VRYPSDPPAALQDFRDAGPRTRRAARDLFNQPFLNDVFHPHQRVILFGRLELTRTG
jgi:hypothetical protein